MHLQRLERQRQVNGLDYAQIAKEQGYILQGRRHARGYLFKKVHCVSGRIFAASSMRHSAHDRHSHLEIAKEIKCYGKCMLFRPIEFPRSPPFCHTS